MADLITRTSLQIFMGVAQVADAQLDLLITQCSARIEEFCGRVFAGGQVARTEYLSGQGYPELPLRQRPVITTGLRVWEDNAAYSGQASGAFDSTTELTIGTDFFLKVDQADGSSRCGLLVRLNGTWMRPRSWEGGAINPKDLIGLGNYKVTYTAGYATVPTDIQQACMILCAAVKNRAQFGQEPISESKENQSYTLRPLVIAAFAALPPDTLAILSRYRNVGVA